MRDKVLAVLQDVRPDVDFEKETRLVQDGILESFDIISLVSELNDEFDITISSKDLKSENFNNIKEITALVERLQSEQG